jgi:hypothetical protein
VLKSFQLRQVGPAPEIDIELAPRLNVLTGDNGLGKTFALDVAWWALTRNWVEDPAWPSPDQGGEVSPRIRFEVAACGRQEDEIFESDYRFDSQSWSQPHSRPPLCALVVYVRADGGFSVWDSIRNTAGPDDPSPPPVAYHLGRDVITNGLIRDWVSWQRSGETMFTDLRQVLHGLSPSSDEPLLPGPPIRVRLKDARDIPTLAMPYATVPLTHASAGLRRSAGLAYLLVWAWYEHQAAARLVQQEPARQIVLLIDELEAHLHPRWQRAILPAILDVVQGLTGLPDDSVQILAATHSPLVLASIEPLFDEARDRVLHFGLENGQVRVAEMPWAKQGDVVGWLTSQVFGLRRARSRDAERAIEAAEAWMRGDLEELPEGLREKTALHEELLRVLPGHDPFWPRWIVRWEEEEDR